ncbi:MAG: type VI secretion system membrane subunit TssM [Polyangiaceae bacterium]
MWLWIIGILIILVAWGLWIYFPPGEEGQPDMFPTWIPIVVTIVILSLLIGLWLIRRIRAARAARALEKAIAQQAQEQALNAKPEDREEIRALAKQMQEGIAALKNSKLGDGSSGEEALYKLPWYAIVGPPGAGKTTALRHSGLVFPFLDSAGGGIRGVGGTRNCDWWFTNEAILLDTAGRYTTEEADHDEWVSFLEQINKFRVDKPLNGVIVAISITDLLEANDDGVATMASRVRARIDEMQLTLKMTMPVYVLFTKVDLIAGFVEFFNDLKKSERGTPWGATYRLDAGITDHGRRFEEEFAILVQQLHLRGLKRLNSERSRSMKEKIYQFPLEFAAVKRPLADFLKQAFEGGSTAPNLRGFYFTSGTQEGKPLDRVVGVMGRAFGLKLAEDQESDVAKEGKSYFLKDVFSSIIFPDQYIAAVTAGELRRRRLQKLAVLAAAAFVSALILIPAVISFFKNRALVDETNQITAKAPTKEDWNDPIAAVSRLNELRSHSQKLHSWDTDGPPLTYTWAMYQGEKLDEQVRAQYVAELQTGFLGPTRTLIEQKLDAARGGDTYGEDYDNLKTYLLLGDKDGHLKNQEYFDFEVDELTTDWVEKLQMASNADANDLRERLEPHVKYYVELLRDGNVKPQDLDRAKVDNTRNLLKSGELKDRLYQLFIEPLKTKKSTNPNAEPDDKMYPDVSMQSIFFDRPEVLDKGNGSGVIASYNVYNHPDRKERPVEVLGIYTAKAHDAILKSITGITDVLKREAWVVPFAVEEKNQEEAAKRFAKAVRDKYIAEYIQAWENFFKDIKVKEPTTNASAIGEYRVLSTPDWPYQRLLQTLKDNTQFVKPKSGLPSSVTQDGGLVDQVVERFKRRFSSKTQGIRPEDLMGPKEIEWVDPIPKRFQSMVEFGIPATPEPVKAQPDEVAPAPKPPKDAQLDRYVGELKALAAEMEILEESAPGPTSPKKAKELFTEAVKNAQKDLQAMDDLGRRLMTEMLMNPLRQGYLAALRGAGGSASGLWEVEVWPPYKNTIKDRYPFNRTATRDASWDDFKKFFKPKDGVLWGFYENHLKEFHVKQGHEFVPTGDLMGDIGDQPKKAQGPKVFNGLMYNCLKRADEITDALWSSGSDDPSVDFFINLTTVSPIVSEVIFEIDGDIRRYRNEKEFQTAFTWPGKGKTKGARIQVRGAGGLDEEIVREGPWGVFRLFESSDSITAVKDDDSTFAVTWQMAAPPITVTMTVKPSRANHPFPLSFFRNMNCPPTIGDNFGGGK